MPSEAGQIEVDLITQLDRFQEQIERIRETRLDNFSPSSWESMEPDEPDIPEETRDSFMVWTLTNDFQFIYTRAVPSLGPGDRNGDVYLPAIGMVCNADGYDEDKEVAIEKAFTLMNDLREKQYQAMTVIDRADQRLRELVESEA